MKALKRLYLFLGSLQFSLIILAGAFLLVLTATLLQTEIGIFQVQQKLFHSWLGGQLVLGLFITNILFSLIQQLPGIRRPLGLVIGHIGLIVLLLGGFTDIFSSYYSLGIWEGRSADQVFYNDRWELSVSLPGQPDAGSADESASESARGMAAGTIHIALPLRALHRASVFSGTIAAGPDRGTAYRVSITRALVNAGPAPDAAGGYVELPWAGNPRENLPYLTGSLKLGDDAPVDFELWAGSSVSNIVPLSRQGRLGSMEFSLEPARQLLPFEIRLDNFQADFYPDSDVPRSFTSRVTIDGVLNREIAMNKPLRYEGYVFYQSSYRFDDSGNAASVFAVQKTSGSFLPYLGTALALSGFLLHYFTRTGKRRKGRSGSGPGRRMPRVAGGGAAVFLLLLLSIGFQGTVGAQDGAQILMQTGTPPPDDESPAASAGGDTGMTGAASAGAALSGAGDVFGRIAVQTGGRIMPIASFGTALLYELSGRRRTAGYDGERFIYDLLFNFRNIFGSRIIRINHPDLFTALGLEAGPPGRYAPADFLPVIDRITALNSGLQKGDDPLGDEIILLHSKLNTLFRLAASFEYLRPGDAGSSAGSSLDPELFRDHPLRILPSSDPGLWIHPMDPSSNVAGADQLREETASAGSGEGTSGGAGSAGASWQEQLAGLYRDGADLSWPGTALNPVFREIAAEQSLSPLYRPGSLALERLYRNLRPFAGAALLFVLAAIAAFASGLESLRAGGPRKAAGLAGTLLLWGGIVLTAAGILLRVLISGRPPVTDLHGTMLFSALVLPLIAMFFGRGDARRGQPAVWTVSAVLLILAPGFISGGDDLAVVQAVLDSNFWLSVHVLVIISGYALVFFASILGHIHAVQLMRFPEGQVSGIARYRNLLLVLRISLLTMFIGTMLGGFWADQSWGRFWGWDPKENAALLLIIYLAIVLHARPAGFFSEFAVAMASAALLMVLMFSWLGVNLMATGLHSYGWDSHSGFLLAGVTAFELIFLITTGFLYRRRRPALRESGVRRYRISSIRRFGGDYIRFELEPALTSLPGQSVTLSLTHRGSRILRAYTPLSSRRGDFLVARREGGQFWEYLSRDARIGHSIYAGQAHGDFVPGDALPEVEIFAAAGAGMAPVISMLDQRRRETWGNPAEAAQRGGEIYLHCGLGNWENFPLIPDMLDLAGDLTGLRVRMYAVELPPEGIRKQLEDAGFRIIARHMEYADFLEDLSAAAARDFSGVHAYVCGSTGFVATLEAQKTRFPGLQLGLWKSEAFTPAGSRRYRPDRSYNMLIRPGMRVQEIRPGQTVMEALFEAGENIRGNCLVGRCGECRCNLISGELRMDEPNALGKQRLESGPFLACCSYPAADIEVEI